MKYWRRLHAMSNVLKSVLYKSQYLTKCSRSKPSVQAILNLPQQTEIRETLERWRLSQTYRVILQEWSLNVTMAYCPLANVFIRFDINLNSSLFVNNIIWSLIAMYDAICDYEKTYYVHLLDQQPYGSC